MKARNKAILSAAAITLLFAAGGCGLNEMQGAYGPPPEEYLRGETFGTSETEETEETEDSHEGT